MFFQFSLFFTYVFTLVHFSILKCFTKKSNEVEIHCSFHQLCFAFDNGAKMSSGARMNKYLHFYDSPMSFGRRLSS